MRTDERQHRSSVAAQNLQIRVWRERWELLFFCWRWMVFLIPATAQAVVIVIAIVDGRTPPLILNGLP